MRLLYKVIRTSDEKFSLGIIFWLDSRGFLFDASGRREEGRMLKLLSVE